MINRVFTVILLVFAFSACSQAKKTYDSPLGYDLNHPETIRMPEELVEISGLTFKEGNDEIMYAIQDEDAKVFSLNLNGNVIAVTKFGKHGDFEDVGIVGNYVVVLRSDGTFFNFPFSEIKTVKMDSVKMQKQLIPSGEYEGLFVRKDSKDIYVLCKNCKADKNQEALSGYIMKMNDSGALINQSSFTISTKDIFRMLGGKKSTFSPSALAFNSKSKEWFVLSSVNKALVILDENWGVKNVYRLNPSMFNQPEGIAFDTNDNLYISNEGGKNGTGTILKFRLQNNTQ